MGRSSLRNSARAAANTSGMVTGATRLGSEKGGVERDIVDAAAGQVEARQSIVVQFICWAFAAGNTFCHMRLRSAGPGNGKVTMKRRRRIKAVSRALFMLVARMARPRYGFHALQQVVDLDIGVAVVAVLDLAALAEEGVGLVEEEDRPAVLRGIEEAAQVFLGLADVFADHRREVDAIEVEAQVVGDHLGCHGLAGAALARKEGVDAQAAVHLVGKPPFFVDLAALHHLVRDLVQHVRLFVGQHQIVPRGFGVQALSQGIQARAHARPAGIPQSIRQGGLVPGCLGHFGLCNVTDGGQIEVELAGQQRRAVGCCSFQRRCPCCLLLSRSWFGDIQLQGWPDQGVARLHGCPGRKCLHCGPGSG